VFARPRARYLRHTFASLLIAQGVDVVFVSRQLGHASVKTTLDTYAHLFDREAQGWRAKMALEAAFGKVLESSGGNWREDGAAAVGREVADFQGCVTSGNRRERSQPL
jgi:UDP-N-acetylmuramyl pentapeptide synthase